MIERKRGHIVAVSSLLGLTSFSNCVTYSTTKAGNDQFMNALYDDLCWQGHDGYINLTTVYPGAIATQKKFETFSDEMLKMPLEDPNYVGHMTVKSMLLNRRKALIPPGLRMLLVLE
jgi:all-trans-retinol dehydrogenase (NAD+)